MYALVAGATINVDEDVSVGIVGVVVGIVGVVVVVDKEGEDDVVPDPDGKGCRMTVIADWD